MTTHEGCVSFTLLFRNNIEKVNIIDINNTLDVSVPKRLYLPPNYGLDAGVVLK